MTMDTTDRAIISATQGGLPLVPQPYHAIAEKIGATPEIVIQRMQAMLEEGIIRRIGAVPNHYALGYQANGMTVWDVSDEHVDVLGEKIGALDFVTHCYRRPRHLPEWRYNLFAMVHGHNREEVEIKAARIEKILQSHCRAYAILYSTRILKKTGLRI
ncbi:MAG: Lrp/AsnC family transcriptional regulator [Methylobacillus sp.]|jgi:DNA-binding Lrp family transcriptional regulator|nr:Lrp/AsnC family transcriptional regulator [Methylobacillus sp.]